MTLLDNQQLALEKLQQYKVGALFMKPGAGKTRVACELIKNVRPDYVLWLTPFQTKDNLAKEISNGTTNSLKISLELSLFLIQINFTSLAEINLRKLTIVTLLWMKV